jgi:hypothetical protein
MERAAPKNNASLHRPAGVKAHPSDCPVAEQAAFGGHPPAQNDVKEEEIAKLRMDDTGT